MPSLILSSRFTSDSKVLREAAQQLGWETLRLDGDQLPEWFDPADKEVALFYTAPHAFDIARQLSRTLLGCSPDWTVRLPHEFLRRDIRQMTHAEALTLPGASFVKHANSKAFPASVYDAVTLAEATANIPPQSLVHVAEPVTWQIEYRCFVADREVATLSPYRRNGSICSSHSDTLAAPNDEFEAAMRFGNGVLKSPAVDCPPAFVLDVGIIEGRGWAVVECNECWASGIYACDPRRVLETLLRACVPTNSMNDELVRWDFEKHYFAACPLP